MDSKTCFVYSPEFSAYLDDLQVSPYMKSKPNNTWTPQEGLSSSGPPPFDREAAVPIGIEELYVSDTLFCSYCNTGFIDQQQQRHHYKLDWHRYNLKQFLSQKKTVSQEKFSQLADDVSSISGSECESETEETDQSTTDVELNAEDDRISHLIARRSRVLFTNAQGKVISVHRCLLLNRKEEATSDSQLTTLMKQLPNKINWLVLMLGGGHFAAAIFKGSEPVVHKTFHSYTVRAKQGGSQSAKDGKGGGHPKSAGASLRRYNEQSHAQHINELMKLWAQEVLRCDFIFYRAVGRGNAKMLFGGPHAPFLKADPRLRTIPFATRRATFSEVKRVHTLLTTAFVYDSSEVFKTNFSAPKPIRLPSEERKKRIESKSSNGEVSSSPRRIDRAKERPSPVRELPGIVQELAALSTSSSSDEEGVHQLTEYHTEVSFTESLQEYEDTVPNFIKKRHVRKKKKEPPSVFADTLSEGGQVLWAKVHSACCADNPSELEEALALAPQSVSKEELAIILGQKNIEGATILHDMAAKGNQQVIRLLMLHGADPCVKDKKARTPYDYCTNKDSRNVFRRFMGEFPTLFDYSKSHIPSPLTDEIESEIANKRKAARKIKKQKDKERKEAMEVTKKEEEEKRRFLQLSDREKRALVAERRLLKQGDSITKSRCFQCAKDITGQVPFEYNELRFCTMACLKGHRIASKNILPPS